MLHTVYRSLSGPECSTKDAVPCKNKAGTADIFGFKINQGQFHFEIGSDFR
jgi:hypothetical protein